MTLNKYIPNDAKKNKAEKKTEDLGFKAAPSEARKYAAYSIVTGDSFSAICRKALKEFMRRHPPKK